MKFERRRSGLYVPKRQRGFITCGPGFFSSARPSGTGDPYWNKVVSLLHFDGSSGSVVIADEVSGNSWQCFGQAKLSTAISMFGGCSLSFPTNSVSNSVKGPSTLSPFAGDFTIEFWVYPITNSTNYTAMFVGVDRTSGPRGFQIGWLDATSIRTSVVGGSPSAVDNVGNLVVNAWNHIAACAQGTTFFLAVNGVSVSSTWTVGQGNASNPITIGSHVDGITDFKGYIDEMRITKGVARYTGDFTPPTAPFPNHS